MRVGTSKFLLISSYNWKSNNTTQVSFNIPEAIKIVIADFQNLKRI